MIIINPVHMPSEDYLLIKKDITHYDSMKIACLKQKKNSISVDLI